MSSAPLGHGDPPSTGGVIAAMAQTARARVVLAVAVGLVATAGEVAIPVAIGWGVDRVVDATNAAATEGIVASLAWALGVIIGVIALTAVAMSIEQRLAVGLYIDGRLWIERRLTTRIFSRRGGVTAAPGALLSLASNDARKIGDTIDLGPRLLTAGAALMLMVGWLVWVDPLIGVAALSGTLLAGAAMAPLSKPLAQRSQIERERLAEAASALSDSMIGLGQAKGLGAEPTLRRWFRSRSSAVRSSAKSQAEAQARIFALVVATPVISILPALWLAARDLMDGSMSVGQFVSVMALAQYLQWPTMEFVQAVETYVQGRASARRVQPVLASPEVLDPGDVAMAIGEIDHLRIDGLRNHGTLTIPIGPLVGVDLGAAGRGAQVASILARTAPIPDHVSVTVVAAAGEFDLERWSLDDLGGQVTIIDGGHPWLPSGSLRAATRLANPTADDRACRTALEIAAVDELLAHPDGLDRRIGERGTRLSGGQRQRVAVAQAMLATTPMLIVVEPTSALDTVTEVRLAERLQRARAGRPTLVFSSSPAVLDRCDVVVAAGDRSSAAAEVAR